LRIPSRIVAGDTVTWRDFAFNRLAAPQDLAITAATYNLSYSFRGPLQAGSADVSGVADGNDWDMTLSGTVTAAFNTTSMANTWYWQAYATAIAGGARLLAGQGELVVEPNLAALSGTVYNGQSLAEQQLAMVKSEITARLNNHARTEYTIGQRHLKFEPMAELLKLQTRLELQVAREKASNAVQNGLGNPNKMQVRFGDRMPRGTDAGGWFWGR